VQGDIADQSLVRQVVRDYGIEAVLHFAAYASVTESMQEPRKYFRNNVTNTLSFLDTLLASGVKRIIFSSTCATYGLPEEEKISEATAQRPVNPYGESKRFIEQVLRWYNRAYGLEWVGLRYFNAAGADPEGEIGERHDPETHLVPLAIESAMGLRGPLRVCGTDYPTADGTAVRDYVHVTDIAKAHVLALQHLVRGGRSGAINLGTGRGHSVLDVIKAVERAGGCPVPYRLGQRRAGDPPRLVADPALAKQTLGWRPKHSSLKSIVRTAWEWHSAGHRAARATAV